MARDALGFVASYALGGLLPLSFKQLEPGVLGSPLLSKREAGFFFGGRKEL